MPTATRFRGTYSGLRGPSTIRGSGFTQLSLEGELVMSGEEAETATFRQSLGGTLSFSGTLTTVATLVTRAGSIWRRFMRHPFG